MLATIKKLLGITPNVYDLPYSQRLYIVALSTSVERVR
jgi:hypothetical protein